MSTEHTRFAIRDTYGRYLRVARGTYVSRRRQWTDDITKATVWRRLSDASNAWSCAIEQKFARPRDVVEVVTVALAVVGVARRMTTANVVRYRYRDPHTNKLKAVRSRGVVTARS